MRHEEQGSATTGAIQTGSGQVADARISKLAPAEAWAGLDADMTAAQLALLASTVLQKSHDDLSALAENDPGIVWNWIEAFARLKAKAEADARLWSAAMASLSTATSPLATAE